MMIRILLFVLSCFAVPALTAQTDHKPLAPVDGIHSLTYSISLNGNQLGTRVRTVKNVDTCGDTTVVELECSDTMSPVSGSKTVHESIVATNDTTFYLIKVPNEFYDLMEKSGAENIVCETGDMALPHDVKVGDRLKDYFFNVSATVRGNAFSQSVKSTWRTVMGKNEVETPAGKFGCITVKDVLDVGQGGGKVTQVTDYSPGIGIVRQAITAGDGDFKMEQVFTLVSLDKR